MKWMTLCLLAACGSSGSDAPPDAAIDAMPAQVVEEDKMLFLGDIAEATLTGGPGDRAVITLSAPVAKLDWNIHGHANGSTQTVEEAFAIDQASYVFEPTSDATWFLLLRNANTDTLLVHVKIELYGAFVWSGWEE